jgi:ABC-type molybdate transport system substrate-binding protein
MVARNNHHQVSRVEDLARPEVRVAMPNEEWEGVARMIREVYRNAGGEALEREIMQTKVEKGTTFITDIHHRQTPLWILQGYADAGVVWKTEVLHQQRLGHPITGIEIPDDENITSVSAAGVMAEAPHHEHATAFLEFLRSAAAQEIFQRYGFGRAPARDRHARHETSHPFTD